MQAAPADVLRVMEHPEAADEEEAPPSDVSTGSAGSELSSSASSIASEAEPEAEPAEADDELAAVLRGLQQENEQLREPEPEPEPEPEQEADELAAVLRELQLENEQLRAVPAPVVAEADADSEPRVEEQLSASLRELWLGNNISDAGCEALARAVQDRRTQLQLLYLGGRVRNGVKLTNLLGPRAAQALPPDPESRDLRQALGEA